MRYIEGLRRGKQQQNSEKEILKQLQKLKDGMESTTRTLKKLHKESWIDELRYKKIKLQKMIQRKQRIMDNANFDRDEKNFFKKAEGGTEHEGQIPETDKFVQFWRDIWKKR